MVEIKVERKTTYFMTPPTICFSISFISFAPIWVVNCLFQLQRKHLIPRFWGDCKMRFGFDKKKCKIVKKTEKIHWKMRNSLFDSRDMASMQNQHGNVPLKLATSSKTKNVHDSNAPNTDRQILFFFVVSNLDSLVISSRVKSVGNTII